MNIYIGNLSYQMTEDEIRGEFEAFGRVSSVNLIKDKFSGQSKGFAFVEMPDSEEAKAAMKALDGKEFGSRTVIVNEARPKTEQGGGGRDRGKFGGGSPRRSNRY